MRRVTTCVLLICIGCGGEEPPRGMVFVLDPAYDEKVATLKLSPEDAARRVRENRKPEDPGLGDHWFIIGDEYVFTYQHDKIGILLDGWYVNGNTGDIRFVLGAGENILLGKYPRWRQLYDQASDEEIHRRTRPLRDD